jgi:hypothetical protein
MSLLTMADRIVSISHDGFQMTAGRVRLATVVKAHNVAEFVFRDGPEGLSKWNILNSNTFPNLRPPFRNTLIEFGAPKWGPAGEWGPAGVSLATWILEDPWEEGSPLNHPQLVDGIRALGETPSRLLSVIPMMETQGRAEILSQIIFALREDGSSVAVASIRNRGEPQEIGWFGMSLSVPALVCLNFLNCRNVRHVEHVPSPKLSRRCEALNGRPAVRFYTLEIEPMKKVLEDEGHVSENGLPKALHICRGHFKDYREHGLFGRQKGLYWWDAHVRGDVERGVVVKDYSVKAPDPGAPR